MTSRIPIRKIIGKGSSKRLPKDTTKQPLIVINEFSHTKKDSINKDANIKRETISSNTFDTQLEEDFYVTAKSTCTNTTDITEDQVNEWANLLDKNFKLSLAAEMWGYTQLHNNSALESKFSTILSKHFKEIVKMDEFVHQNLNFITYLLRLDELHIDSELEVFKAAIKWLAFDWPLRKTTAPLILETVRFALMTDEEWGTCLSTLDTQALGLLSICQDILYEAMVYKVALNSGHEREFQHFAPKERLHLRNKNDSTKKRVSFQEEQPLEIEPLGEAALIDISSHDLHLYSAILCFGGLHSTQHLKSLYKGDTILGLKPMENTWKNVGNIPESRLYLAATVSNAKIYISGGYDPNVLDHSKDAIVKNTFWCLDPKSNEWKMMSPMLQPRAHHSMVATFDCIYAIGGLGNTGGPIGTMECYNLNANFWKEVSPLPVPSLGMAACEYRGSIWICGGIVGTEHNPRRGRVTDMVFTYDPAQNLWHFGTALRNPRAFGNLVELEGSLHIIGGFTATNTDTGSSAVLSTIDMFHNSTHRWVFRSEMLLPRHSAAAAVTGDRLYVIGGITSENTTASVECYDSTSQQWLTDVPRLPIPLAGLTCVVLSI